MRKTLLTIVIAGFATAGFAQTPAPAAPQEPASTGMSKTAKFASIAGIAAGAITSSVAIAKAGGGSTETTSFGTMDANKDGALSADEFNAGMTGIFKNLDANGDGTVTRAEAVAGMGDKGGTYYDRLDPKKAGSVSMATFHDVATKVFTAVDADANGSISGAERDAAKAKMAAAGSHE